MLLILQVIVCIALVIIVGTWLSQSADIMAEKTGLGRTWVGTILLAGVTSLPELATGSSAIVVCIQRFWLKRGTEITEK